MSGTRYVKCVHYAVMSFNGGKRCLCRRQRRSGRLQPRCKLGTGVGRKRLRIPLRLWLEHKRGWDTYRTALFDGRTGRRVMVLNDIHKSARCRMRWERGRCRHVRFSTTAWFQGTQGDGRKDAGKVGRGLDVSRLGGGWRKSACAPARIASGNTLRQPMALRVSQWGFGTGRRSSWGLPLLGGRRTAFIRR